MARKGTGPKSMNQVRGQSWWREIGSQLHPPEAGTNSLQEKTARRINESKGPSCLAHIGSQDKVSVYPPLHNMLPLVLARPPRPRGGLGCPARKTQGSVSFKNASCTLGKCQEVT